MRALLVLLPGLLACLATPQPGFAVTATVGFETLARGTDYGAAFGNSPGDQILTENGIQVRLREFTSGRFTGFIRAEVGGFMASRFDSVPMTLSNISLEFDLRGLGFEIYGVTFEYADAGGSENLRVNGDFFAGGLLSQAPPTLGGVGVQVSTESMSGGVRGLVALTGPVSSFVVGGQEFGIDYIVVTGGCPFDPNGDCRIDLLDLDILGANFGLTGGATIAQGDLNGDSNVDLLDLDILGANFQSGPALTVPEPAVLSLFAVAFSAFAMRRLSRTP